MDSVVHHDLNKGRSLGLKQCVFQQVLKSVLRMAESHVKIVEHGLSFRREKEDRPYDKIIEILNTKARLKHVQVFGHERYERLLGNAFLDR